MDSRLIEHVDPQRVLALGERLIAHADPQRALVVDLRLIGHADPQRVLIDDERLIEQADGLTWPYLRVQSFALGLFRYLASCKDV